MPRPAGRSHSVYFEYPRFPFVTPPELRGERPQHPVVIVGGGPVGLTAALELARHGVASVVLDEKDTVNDGSRAICVARHSLEIFQQLGVSQRFTDKALGWTRGTSYYRTQPVYRLQMPHSEQERFYPMYNIQQQYIEQFLVERAMAEPLIDLRWQTKFESLLESCGGGVIVEVDTPGGYYSLRADYLLAADGARSSVRHCRKLDLKGDAYEGRYVIVDIQMRSDYPVERRAFFDPPANPGSTVLIHRQPDDIWRIDYQLQDGEDDKAALDEANVRRRVASILEMVGEKGSWELEWWSLYKAYTLALDDYRDSLVLFLGDAAHLVPIFGVRGLNSGLADAANAAWKLAYVIRGWADARLLDSYSPERRGATLEVFENAARSTRFMTPPTRGQRLLRDAALALAVDHDFTRPLINPRQSSPYTYAASPLTSFLERDAAFAAGPCAGAPLVNQRLGENDFLLDHLGKGFSGIYFSADGSLPPLLAPLCRSLAVGKEAFTPIVLGPAHQTVWENYGARDGTFYLVRPDRHVCARWAKIEPNEVRKAFSVALGGA